MQSKEWYKKKEILGKLFSFCHEMALEAFSIKQLYKK